MPINRPKLLIRADAGPAVGTGHVTRSLSIAREWRNSGGTVTFACGMLPRGLLKKIAAEHFHFIPLKHSECDQADADETKRIAATMHPDWIILDGDRFFKNYLVPLKQAQSKLLLIGENASNNTEFADIVLDQTAKSISPVTDRHHEHCISLSGPEFALLDEFALSGEFSLSTPKQSFREARKILVSLGDNDQENWTLKTLQSISDLEKKKIVVDCVIGSRYSHAAELNQFKRQTKLNLRIHRNRDRVQQLLPRIDLAISSSSAAYQLAYGGIPTVIIDLNGQPPRVYSLLKQPILGLHGQSEATCRQELKQHIKQLIENPEQRTALSEIGQRQVDGLGAKRVVRTMKTGNLTLRPAIAQDSPTIWRWHNDPEVKSVALANSHPTLDEFAHEFQTRLASPNRHYWIFENTDGTVIGYACFEELENQRSAKISVVVDHSKRGRGVGTAIITQASEKLFRQSNHLSIVAQIRPGNIASEKAFRAAGFSGIQPAIVYGQMALQFELQRPSEIPLQSFREIANKAA